MRRPGARGAGVRAQGVKVEDERVRYADCRRRVTARGGLVFARSRKLLLQENNIITPIGPGAPAAPIRPAAAFTDTLRDTRSTFSRKYAPR